MKSFQENPAQTSPQNYFQGEESADLGSRGNSSGVSGNCRRRNLCDGVAHQGNRRQSRYRPQKNKIFHEDLLVAAL